MTSLRLAVTTALSRRTPPPTSLQVHRHAAPLGLTIPTHVHFLSHPRSAGEEGLCSAVFYFFSYIFSDCCQTNYLNIYTKLAGLVERGATDSPDCLPILLSISVFSLCSSCSPLLVFLAVDWSYSCRSLISFRIASLFMSYRLLSLNAIIPAQ